MRQSLQSTLTLTLLGRFYILITSADIFFIPSSPGDNGLTYVHFSFYQIFR